jgi:hypothetical protein
VHNYYFKIEVKGRGRFPIDQLRRYEMFPINVETVTAIENSLNPEAFNETFEYTLGMYASTLGADAPMAARFASFGFAANTLEVWKDDKLFYAGGEVVHRCESCDSVVDTDEVDDAGKCETCVSKGF